MMVVAQPLQIRVVARAAGQARADRATTHSERRSAAHSAAAQPPPLQLSVERSTMPSTDIYQVGKRANDHSRQKWRKVISLVKLGSPIATACHACKLPARAAEEAARDFENGQPQGKLRHWLGGELSAARAHFRLAAMQAGDQSLDLQFLIERGEFDNPPPDPVDIRKEVRARLEAMIVKDDDEEDDDND